MSRIGLIPSLPYVLPDGSVVERIEDIEIGMPRVLAAIAVGRATGARVRWDTVARDLKVLLRVHGQKYDKYTAHSLLARAVQALRRIAGVRERDLKGHDQEPTVRRLDETIWTT